jgi:hypothetical protein
MNNRTSCYEFFLNFLDTKNFFFFFLISAIKMYESNFWMWVWVQTQNPNPKPTIIEENRRHLYLVPTGYLKPDIFMYFFLLNWNIKFNLKKFDLIINSFVYKENTWKWQVSGTHLYQVGTRYKCVENRKKFWVEISSPMH